MENEGLNNMENEGLNNNSNEQAHDGFTIDEIPDLAWNSHMDYDVDALLGAEDHVNTSQTTDDVNHSSPVGETASKRAKRFTMDQIQELEAQFRVCSHPNPDVRQELGAKIGLEERQVKFWFQNRRSQKKLKACGDENKDIRQELAKLKAEHEELKQRTLNPICFRCRNPTVAIQSMSEKWRMLNENAKLREEYVRAKAYMDRLIREAAELPPSAMSFDQHHLASAHMDMDPAVAFTSNHRTTPNLQATLISHAERAMKEFVMLATKAEPMWVPSMDGEMLNHQQYILQTFPGLLGLCPQGFVEEATRETDMIKGTAMDLVSVLTDVNQWSDMFPGIVAYVSSSNVISSGSSSLRDGLIQLMNVELWVQSPRLLNRSVKFLRFSKMMANRRWAVVDVSVDGICGVEQQCSSTNYTTSCRLLPSGCLLEDMSGGYCKVTWVMHAYYDETTVPLLFRPFLQSGQALGACRWLRSLQRQCEYMSVLRSSHVIPSSSSSSAISTLGVGRRSVLELAGRMMASFYAAVSGPVTLVPATSSVDEWRVVSSGSGAERVEVAVRLAIWNCADIMPAEPSVTVLSATTTVWLPGTPPLHVFEYLCDLQRRGEWDTHVDGGEVQELGSVATSAYLHGKNAVSVLQPTTVVTDEKDSKVLILQETSTDMSCSVVVYSLIEENLMRGIMDGRERSSIFVVPSGFAILPDGHGKAHADHTSAANSSSSAAIDGHSSNAGSLVTVAFQTLLPGNPSGNLRNGAFEDARHQLCHAITKIKAGVGASNIVPA